VKESRPHVEEQPLSVLVVDDDRQLCDRLTLELKLLGCRAHTAKTAEMALARCQDGAYQLALCDLQLGEQSGLDLIPKLLAINPNLHITVFTAFASFETAVKAMRAGASNYLPKPFTSQQLRELISSLRDERYRIMRMTAYETSQRGSLPSVELESRSASMQHALGVIQRAAKAEVSVLIRGENGTGKSVLAHALHVQSARASKPFVIINCPSLSDELLNSELFGHLKGSFTGAVKDQAGKVEAAEGGTLFLDELGDLSLAIQSKLLRFLQDRRYERLGDTLTRSADVRIVAATNRDVEALVREGRFREDLLYRLNVIEVTVPPLRDRKEDIAILAHRFLAEFADETQSQVREFSPAAIEVMQAYPWPGNVRELRNELQRIVVLWPSRVVEPDAFSQRVLQRTPREPRVGGEWSLEEIEAEHIRKVLASCDTFDSAAAVLRIEPSTLWRKRRRLGL
jgi:two-component system, NtrC family, response regulator AlgB